MNKIKKKLKEIEENKLTICEIIKKEINDKNELSEYGTLLLIFTTLAITNAVLKTIIPEKD